MDTSESEFGLSLTLHSKANLNIYKNNKPCSFTNVLKVPVKLDQNEKYEVCLANIHAPSTHAFLLERSDFRRNDVRFHIGYLKRWLLQKPAQKQCFELFTYS